MKVRKLSFSLLWKISILLVIAFASLEAMTFTKIKKFNRENTIVQSEYNYNNMLQVVANVNSVLMQQMRVYTMFEFRYESNPATIQKRLVQLAKSRYKDFEHIGYVDYATGKEYLDDGTVSDVSKTDYFIEMSSLRELKKAEQLYGDLQNDEWYSICKDGEPKGEDGRCLGFYIGKTKISYIQRFINKLTHEVSFKSKEGFYLVVNSSFKIICAPDTSYVGKNLLDETIVIDKDIGHFVEHPVDRIGTDKVTLSGDVVWDGKRFNCTIGQFTKTRNWSILVFMPYETIDSYVNSLLVANIIMIAVIAIAVLVLIAAIFQFSFKPLGELNDKFIEIAKDDVDLTKRLSVKESNEIGQIKESFNKYLLQLQNMVSDIKTSDDEMKAICVDIESLYAEINSIISSKIAEEDSSSHDIAEIDILFRKLSSKIKDFYKSIDRISKNVDSFKV